jgi:hypothetical protein
MKWGVDGDIIVYSVAFAAKDDPVEYALKSTRSAVEQIMFDVKADSIGLFLTGKGNYRIGLDPDYPYKGNRKSERPAHFHAIKDYMVETLGAVVFEDEEADDALGYHAVQDGWGIATIDKDLDGIPGWHYNWKRKEVYMVGPEDADRFFYKQLLTGDSTDNIPGLFKRTGVKAMKKTFEPLEYMDNTRDMYDHVRQIYLDAVADQMMSSDVDDVERWLLTQARSLWIRRERGEVWGVPNGQES